MNVRDGIPPAESKVVVSGFRKGFCADAWKGHAHEGRFLEAAKFAALDQEAQSGLATTFALIAVAERLDSRNA